MIAIAIPSLGFWQPDFGLSLAMLTGYDNGTEITVMNVRLPSLGNAREKMLRASISIGASHVLYLDSDMVFPPDVLVRLLAHNEHFVVANYVTKVQHRPVVRDVDRGYIYSTGKTGLEAIGFAGLGVALVKLSGTVKGMAIPRFKAEWSDEVGYLVDEDFYFCEKLREEGLTLYVDHGLSHSVFHLGTKAFGIQLAKPV